MEIGDAGSVEAARALLNSWGLAGPRPVLVCVGGARGLRDEGVVSAVRDLFRDQVLPALERVGGLVVDGGTHSGVMRLLGEAAGDTKVPLLGVAAAGTVRVPGRPSPTESAPELDPNHTGVLLVEGAAWGDESPWLAIVAGLVADGAPSATLLVNGGEIAFLDAAVSVRAARPLVVVEGTGRTADVIAATLRTTTTMGDGEKHDPRAVALAGSGLVRAVGIEDPGAVAATLGELLG